MGANDGMQQGFSNTMADDAGFPSSGVSSAAKGLLPQQMGQPSLPAQRAQLPGEHIPSSNTAQGAFQPVVGGPAQGSQFRTPPTTLSSGAQSALRAYSITSANQPSAAPKPAAPSFQPTPPPAVGAPPAGIQGQPLALGIATPTQSNVLNGFLGNTPMPGPSAQLQQGLNGPKFISAGGTGQPPQPPTPPTPAPATPTPTPAAAVPNPGFQTSNTPNPSFAQGNGQQGDAAAYGFTDANGQAYDQSGNPILSFKQGNAGTTPVATAANTAPNAQQRSIDTTQNAYQTGGAYDTWQNQGIQDQLGMAQRNAAAQAGAAGYGFDASASAPALQAQASAQGAQLQQRGQLEQMQQSANQQAFAMRLQQAGFDQQSISNALALYQQNGMEPDAATLNAMMSQYPSVGTSGGVQNALQTGATGDPAQTQQAFAAHSQAIQQFLGQSGGLFDVGNKRGQIVSMVEQMSPQERKMLKGSAMDQQIQSYMGQTGEGDQYTQLMSGVY